MSTTRIPSGPARTADKKEFGPAEGRAAVATIILVAVFVGCDAVTHLMKVDHVREASAGVGTPDHLIAILTAVLVWAGAWPRDARLRALVRA